MDYASVDFWMKTQHIYRSTFTFLTLLTAPHLVFSLVPKNKTRANSARSHNREFCSFFSNTYCHVLGPPQILWLNLTVDVNCILRYVWIGMIIPVDQVPCA